MPKAKPNPAALLSLSDRTGAIDLAKALAANGYTMYATSGTRAFLEQNAIEVRDVEDLTGFPPLFDGRVKTLHPKIFGAILYDRDSDAHVREAETYAMADIRVVAVNLYPLEEGEIDVGGVSLLRAAAKNHKHVTVLSDPSQYVSFAAELPNGPGEEKRKALAIAAFSYTAGYDRAIEGLLRNSQMELRYGENPQFAASFVGGAQTSQLHGKALSYNNLLDLDATLRVLDRAALPVPDSVPPNALVRLAVVKHTVPCGVAQREQISDAAREAINADAVSAFGGIVATDGIIDVATAEILSAHFLEVIAAPEFEPAALSILQRKKQLRVMRYPRELPRQLQGSEQFRSALGGLLTQSPNPQHEPEAWRVVSKREPSPQEWQDVGFAWDVVRHVKSNGIVIAREGVTRGICAGQTNRVSAVKIAAHRAGDNAKGAACASDGFFPFADGLEAAADAGCSAIIAPGGSVRDGEVIEAANRLGVALIFSNRRYFLH